MEEIFVTKLRINKVRHLENLEIPLSETERKHLILTGKNGSGKTSVLEGINVFLNSNSNESEVDENVKYFFAYKEEIEKREKKTGQHYDRPFSSLPKKSNEINIQIMKDKIKLYQSFIETNAPIQLFSNVDLFTKNGSFQENFTHYGDFIIKYFPSKRTFQPKESLGPQKIELKEQYGIYENVNENFVRQLVNLRLDLLDAKDSGKTWEVEKVEQWFKRFESTLKNVFEDESLEVLFDRPNFNYNIITKGKEPFNLNQLSDGYAAFLSIISELMMRMDKKFTATKPYDLQGIVLIDEIETHLHIDLQKKILPFLTSFFPKIQFIVTTHSPFVLSSINNAVIYDLEKQQIGISDLSGYSADGIIEGYFEQDKYSEKLKGQVSEYEILMGKDVLNDDESDKLYFLEKYFEELPKFLAPELQVKIQQIKLAKLA